MRWTRAFWWLALVGVAAAAVIAANVVLLDVAQSQDEPVGKLSPRVFVQTVAPATTPQGDTEPPATSTGSGDTTPATTGSESTPSTSGSDEPDQDDHGSTRGQDADD